MDSQDQVRFLTPWTLLLPVGGGRVLTAVGSGGKSALLDRLYRHYRAEGFSVLWTQTVDHAPPTGLMARSNSAPLDELRKEFRHHAALFVAGERDAEGRARGLSAQRVEELRRALAPDVVLVEAQARRDRAALAELGPPEWPEPVHLVFAVAGLQEVGRIRSHGTEGALRPELSEEGDQPLRIRTQDVLRRFTAPGGLLDLVPQGVPCLPFLAGLGSFRDLDGMFELVATLWEDARVKAVLLGELTGQERIDAAEEAAAAPLGGAPHLSGERVYALYPSRLDEVSE
jgi:hypothetical protein